MGERYVHTPIGIIDTSEEMSGYVCGERPGTKLGKEIIIKSCKTKVIITRADGSEDIIEPILIESCMNPELKTILPITVRAIYSARHKRNMVYVSNKYEVKLLDIDSDIVSARTEKYIPKPKRAECAECTNCGRC